MNVLKCVIHIQHYLKKHFSEGGIRKLKFYFLYQERSLSQEQEASLKIMHPTSVEGVDDMIKLGDMTEAGLLRNLQLRHKQGIIYVSHMFNVKDPSQLENLPLADVCWCSLGLLDLFIFCFEGN